LAGSKRISAKKSAAITSAIEQQLGRWPLPASDVEVSESMRNRVAMFGESGNECGAITRHGREVYAASVLRAAIPSATVDA
jgi:hypothetical protein